MVVVADRHGAEGEWIDDAALDLLRRGPLPPSVPIVFAGAAQHRTIAAAARELGINPSRLVGSAPEALASCAGALTALAAGVSPSDVAISVVGVPGRFVIAWNESSVGGSPAEDRLAAHVLARLDAQVLTSWPPGPYALGSAAAAVIGGVLKGSPRRRTVFAVLGGFGEHRAAVAALPATLGPAGIAALHAPSLSPREQAIFETGLAISTGARR